MKKYLIPLFLFAFLSCCGAAETATPKQEIRAVWLATVYGLDWPRLRATDAGSRRAQQRALCEMLDRLHDANFNMVFFQVRLRGDVLYTSSVEPFASVLTGKAGQHPGYDPLAFAIEECHKRGMECHAWIVVFPLGTDKAVRSQGKRSVVKRRPELCKRHQGEWYLNPSVPETADYLLSLVKEIVEGYDIDGIHFDYIRYPEQAAAFSDQAQYRRSGRKQPLADWRRDNINRLVARLYDYVKRAKPWVLVSSSPLGKYSRIPEKPDAGWTAYESVYQDAQRWMLAGKQDMLVPMMYYKLDDFFPFLDDWIANANGRWIVPGLGAYRMAKEEGAWELTDITDQIDYSRYFGGMGCAFFRCGSVLGNEELYAELKDRYFRYPAQLPPMEWLDDSVPASPREVRVERVGGDLRLSWNKPAGRGELTYTLYCAVGDSIPYALSRSVLATGVRDTVLFLPVDTTRERGLTFSVSASTRYHIESAPSEETFYYLSRFLK